MGVWWFCSRGVLPLLEKSPFLPDEDKTKLVKFARRRTRDPAPTLREIIRRPFRKLNTREIRIARNRRSVLVRRNSWPHLVPREEVTFSGSDGPIPELCHEMDSLGPAVSKLQGKTERRLPLSSTAGHSSFRTRSFSAGSGHPRCSRSILQPSTYSLPPSTGPTGKGLRGPEHPTSIRHFGPCYDTPLAWLPYCEILAAFFPHPFTSSLSSFPVSLFLLHSTFLIVSIFFSFLFLLLYPSSFDSSLFLFLSFVPALASVRFAPLFCCSKSPDHWTLSLSLSLYIFFSFRSCPIFSLFFCWQRIRSFFLVENSIIVIGKTRSVMKIPLWYVESSVLLFSVDRTKRIKRTKHFAVATLKTRRNP